MAACEKCGNLEILMGECQVCMKSEIERLRADNKKLKFALSSIIETCTIGCEFMSNSEIVNSVLNTAQKALTTCDQSEGRN